MNSARVHFAITLQQLNGDGHERLLADVIAQHHKSRMTGALFVLARQNRDDLVRFYFREGEVYSVSYGPLEGAECLYLLRCFDLTDAIFIDSVKAPFATPDIPATGQIFRL